MRPSMHVWKIFFLYTKSFFKSYESLRHCELTTNVPNYCMNHRMPKCIFLLEAGLRIRSDIDRIRINLSGQTGSGSMHVLKTGSGSRNLCLENFSSIL